MAGPQLNGGVTEPTGGWPSSWVCPRGPGQGACSLSKGLLCNTALLSLGTPTPRVSQASPWISKFPQGTSVTGGCQVIVAMMRVISPAADATPRGIPLRSEDTIGRTSCPRLFLLVSYWPVLCVLYFSYTSCGRGIILPSWYVSIRNLYSAIKRSEIRSFKEMLIDLESVVQNEISQKEKNKNPTLMHVIWNLEKWYVHAQPCLTLLDPMDCSLPGSSCPRDSPGKNTGVSSCAFLQGIFPTQG